MRKELWSKYELINNNFYRCKTLSTNFYSHVKLNIFVHLGPVSCDCYIWYHTTW